MKRAHYHEGVVLEVYHGRDWGKKSVLVKTEVGKLENSKNK